MSLKVWLPLDGDLHNQGISEITFSGTPTWQNFGKIGSKAYNLSTRTSFNCPALANVKYFSVAFWCMIEPNTESTANWMDILSLTDKSINDTTGYFRFETGYGNTAQGGIHWHDNATNAIINGSYTYNTASEQNQWHHIVVTVSNTAVCSYYDGVLKQTHTSNLGGGHLTGAGWIGESTTRGSIQDIRIYDHCLSAAEVKEIAQGLVLHYKLDDSYIEMPTFIESTINTTAYNGATGKYGYNETSNLAKTTGFFQGKNCIKISTITEGQEARPYSYFSNLFTSNGTNAPAYKALSFDYFTTCPTTTWLNIYKLGSGEGTATWKTTNSTGVHSGVYTNSSNAILVTPNEWNHVEVILHGTTDANAEWGYCINGPTHTSNLNYYFLFANIQLEENNHTTGYKANMHKSIITDSSGYGHNGTINGTLTTSSDTAKYSSCVYMPKTTTITHSRPIYGGTDQEWTCCMWVKLDTTNQSIQQMNNFNSGNDIVYAADGKPLLYLNSGTNDYYNYGNLAVSAGVWTHIAFVFKNSNATKLIYINGVNHTNTNGPNKTSTPNGIPDIITVGTNLAGYISDYRIYCTPLLDTDIKQLYNIAMKIDNLGSVHTFEFIEQQSNIIFPIELSRSNLEFTNGLNRYTQTNCQVTLTDQGYHIYRPPNLTTANDGNTMWGGLKLVNQKTDTIAAYDSNRDNNWGLQKGHTYFAAFHAKGKSSNSTSWGWGNNMGWSGGGVNASPTIITNIGIPSDFQGEKDCIFIFTINDNIAKNCTSAYSSYVANTTYLSYRHLTFGWGYSSTGALGTDLYLTDLRLYDITNYMAKITKQGQAKFYDFIEQLDKAQIRRNSEFLSSNFIER